MQILFYLKASVHVTAWTQHSPFAMQDPITFTPHPLGSRDGCSRETFVLCTFLSTFLTKLGADLIKGGEAVSSKVWGAARKTHVSQKRAQCTSSPASLPRPFIYLPSGGHLEAGEEAQELWPQREGDFPGRYLSPGWSGKGAAASVAFTFQSVTFQFPVRI